MKPKILSSALIMIFVLLSLPCLAQKPDLVFDLKERINLLAFSEDEKTLAVETSSDFIVYDIAAGKPLNQFERFSGFANSAVFSRDGKFLIRGDNPGKVRLFNAADLSLVKTFSVSQWSIYALAVSQSDRVLAVDAADGTIQLWNIDSGEKIQTLGDEGGRIKFMSFSAGDEFLAATTIDHKLNFFNVETAKTIFSVQRGGADSPVIFCPQSDELAISFIGSVDFLDVKNGQINRSFILPKENSFFTAHARGGYYHGRIIISPDCQMLAVSDWKNNTITILDVKTGKVRKIFSASDMNDRSYNIAFSPNMRFIAAGSTSGKVRLWRIM